MSDMTEPSAKIIVDSISPMGHRLTTMEVVFHRYVLAEFNTHRLFSRNSASSRAIPVRKQIGRVKNDLALPVVWAAEQKGMQGGDEIENPDRAEWMWGKARDAAVVWAEALSQIGVHKSITNRLIEPFMWHTAIISATEWDGFWMQRCSPLAQPEMRAVAEKMKEAYDGSEPTLVDNGRWHLPYIDVDDHSWASTQVPYSIDGLEDRVRYGADLLTNVSVARCARVSYLTHDGKRDQLEDIAMYERLVSASPPHASPLEHVATPCLGAHDDLHPGNFRGWDQLRHRVLDF